FIVVTACVVLVALTALVYWELRVADPVVNLRVLTNIPLLAGVSLGVIFGLTSFGSIFILPLFFQQLRGYGVMDVGLSQMLRSLVMLVVALISGRLYSLVDSRLVIAGGIVLMMAGYFDLAHLTLEVDGWQMLPGLLLTGAGMAFVFTAMSAAVMRTIPPPLMTAATGLYTLSRCIGGNLGYALLPTHISHPPT